jgi:PAS domain S-box-containing protein
MERQPLPPSNPTPSGVPKRPSRGRGDADIRLLDSVDVLPVGVVHVDPQGAILLANRRFCEMVGRSLEDLVARRLQHLVVSEDRQGIDTRNSALISGRADDYRVDIRFVRQDGSTIPARLTMAAARDRGGAVTFLAGIVDRTPPETDVDERIRDMRAALEAAQTGTYRWDIREGDLEWDENLDRLFGLEPGSVERTFDQFLKMVSPDDRVRVMEALWTSVGDGGDLELAFRVVRPDGSVHWLLDKGHTVVDSHGTPLYMTGACTDITARVSSEQAVSESEARLRAVIDTSPLAIAILDTDGNAVFRNPKCDELHGMDVAKAGPGGWTQNVHPDDKSRVTDSMYSAVRERRHWTDTYRLQHPDGKVIWVSGRAAPLDFAGQPAGFVGTLEDITPLKQAEQAVRESESKLRRITDSGMVGVFYWNVNGEITDANDEFLRMLGYSRGDLRAGRLHRHRLTPARWHPMDRAKIREVVTNGVTSSWETEVYTNDGRTIPVLVAQALLSGVEDQGIAICLDVSERREAELERDRLLAREHEARAQAERAIRLRDEVLAVVAHDLRNPVGIIAMSASSMIGLPMDEEERTRQLGIIQRAATGMDLLISDLLDVSRMEAGSFAIKRSKVDVQALIAEAVDLFETQANGRKVVLKENIASDIQAVSGDRDRLAQALSNLLSNAIKFTPTGGTVTLSAMRVDGQLQISVTDTGPGIAADDQQRIFDRFWQVDRTSRAGAGLGLAIVKGIVESHGGRIWVESEPGRGTTFHFTIPHTAS